MPVRGDLAKKVLYNVQPMRRHRTAALRFIDEQV